MHPRGRSKIAPARIGRRRGHGPQPQGMRHTSRTRMPDRVNNGKDGQGDGRGRRPHIAERQGHVAACIRSTPFRQPFTARFPPMPAQGEGASAGRRPPCRANRTGQARQGHRVHTHVARLPAGVGIGIAFADPDEPRQADNHAGQRHDRRRVDLDHFPNCPPDLHAAFSLAHAASPGQPIGHGNFQIVQNPNIPKTTSPTHLLPTARDMPPPPGPARDVPAPPSARGVRKREGRNARKPTLNLLRASVPPRAPC